MPEHTNTATAASSTVEWEDLTCTNKELYVSFFSWAALREGLWQHLNVIIVMKDAKGT